MAHTDDFEGITYRMAIFLNKQGVDCFHVLRGLAEIKVAKFKKRNIKKVKITNFSDSCSHCKEISNKVISIDEAIKQMPIPCKKCSYKIYDRKNNFCRCDYQPVVDLGDLQAIANKYGYTGAKDEVLHL